MDRLTLLKTLVTAVDEGSLNRAAQRLGLSQPAVSQQIKHLEQILERQLLSRTATGVVATRAGHLTVAHAHELLQGFQTLKSELAEDAAQFTGRYRVSIGNMLGRTILTPILLELNQKYPDLNIVIRMEDRYVDVVREHFDLAIRAGGLGSTDGYGRKLGALETVLVATPSYLSKHGRPKTPADLSALKYIQYGEEDHGSVLEVFEHGDWHRVPITTGFTVDDPMMLLEVLKTGTGFSRVPWMLAKTDLATGQLERILPDIPTRQKEIYAVYPTQSGVAPVQAEILSGVVSRLRTDANPRPDDTEHLRLVTA